METLATSLFGSRRTASSPSSVVLAHFLRQIENNHYHTPNQSALPLHYDGSAQSLTVFPWQVYFSSLSEEMLRTLACYPGPLTSRAWESAYPPACWNTSGGHITSKPPVVSALSSTVWNTRSLSLALCRRLLGTLVYRPRGMGNTSLYAPSSGVDTSVRLSIRCLRHLKHITDSSIVYLERFYPLEQLKMQAYRRRGN